MDELSGPLYTQRQAVGARVQVHLRKPLLDVLAHLDRPLVQEGFAIVEEVDPRERGSGFVDHPGEEIEIEHPRLPRPRDPGLGRAAGLEAGNIARRRALDVEPRGKRPGVEWTDGGRGIVGQR